MCTDEVSGVRNWTTLSFRANHFLKPYKIDCNHALEFFVVCTISFLFMNWISRFGLNKLIRCVCLVALTSKSNIDQSTLLYRQPRFDYTYST